MATIAEKSRTKEIIDHLQGIIDNASAVPLAPGKISVYKDEAQSLLTELATQIEIELKTYHEVNDRKGKIIGEAKKEAERIIYQAEHSASRMRVTKRATDVAPLDYDTLNDEERTALSNASEIYGASLIYTDEMLTEVTNLINDAYRNIRNDYEIILQVLEEKLDTINVNRAELMNGLQEMDDADRSQQILEIGQLLSSELYMSRMKAKMDSDEYDDGSVQLSFDLQEEQEEKTRQAEEKAQRAEAALAEMMAQRDALAATVEQMQKENETSVQPASESAEDVEYEIVYVTEDELEEGEEYEIEYVDEDELEYGVEYEIEYVNEEDLEEGEEYEVEYVDEEEPEEVKFVKKMGEQVFVTERIDESAKKGLIEREQAKNRLTRDKTLTEPVKEKEGEKKTTENQFTGESGKLVHKNLRQKQDAKEAIKDLEIMEKESEKAPVIPRFKKSESVASVPSEKVAKMAKAITTDKKYSGLISRAVKQKEKAEEEATVSIEKDEPVQPTTRQQTEGSVSGIQSKNAKDSEHDTLSAHKSGERKTMETAKKKDDDIKTDSDGKEYVKATMQVDEDFEIMEF